MPGSLLAQRVPRGPSKANASPGGLLLALARLKTIIGNQRKSKMARGGKRHGSGRKAGTANVKSREIADRIAAMTIRTTKVANKIAKMGGISMLEIMVENARHFHQVAKDAEAVLDNMAAEALVGTELDVADQFKMMLAEVKKAAGLRLMAQQCAQEAARFMHAPIAAVSSNANAAGEIIVPLAERLKAYAAEDAIAASGGKVVPLKGKRVQKPSPSSII